MEISVWYMEVARMEWKAIFHISIQFHTRFRAWYVQKNISICRIVINNILSEMLNIYFYLSTNRGISVACNCANSVCALQFAALML